MSQLASYNGTVLGPSMPAKRPAKLSRVPRWVYWLLAVPLLAVLLLAVLLGGSLVILWIWDRPFTGSSDPPPIPGRVLVQNSLTSESQQIPGLGIQTHEGYLIEKQSWTPRNLGKERQIPIFFYPTLSSSAIAQSGAPKGGARSLPIADGEFRISAKIVRGHEHAAYRILLRDNPPREKFEAQRTYRLDVTPAKGSVRLNLFSPLPLPMSPPIPWKLAARSDLASLRQPDEWHTIAVRMRGPDFWVLIDDQLVLTATDSTLMEGSWEIEVYEDSPSREGASVAIVFRDLRISSLKPEP